MQGLANEVDDLAQDAELSRMKQRIGALQVLYLVLFGASLVLLVYNYRGSTPFMNVLWAASLGGAVVTRLVRTSMVNKYNQRLAGDVPSVLR